MITLFAAQLLFIFFLVLNPVAAPVDASPAGSLAKIGFKPHGVCVKYRELLNNKSLTPKPCVKYDFDDCENIKDVRTCRKIGQTFRYSLVFTKAATKIFLKVSI